LLWGIKQSTKAARAGGLSFLVYMPILVLGDHICRAPELMPDQADPITHVLC